MEIRDLHTPVLGFQIVWAFVTNCLLHSIQRKVFPQYSAIFITATKAYG
jgi:hypothetical protein